MRRHLFDFEYLGEIPRVNHAYPMNWKTGKRYKDSRVERIQEAIGWAAKAELAERRIVVDKEAHYEVVMAHRRGCLRVSVYVSDAPTGDGDVDGPVKPVLDALKGVLYHDDKQVVSTTARFAGGEK